MSLERIFSVEFLLLLLLLFILYNFFDLIFPPKIKLIYPKNKIIITKNDSITFKGFVDKRSELFINDLPVYYDNEGYFEQTFYLKEGLNRFIIRAKKYWGQEKIVEREIFYRK